MKAHRNALLMALCLLNGLALTAQEPFHVSARFESDADGRQRVSVSFSVPERHTLYADTIAVEGADGVKLTPLIIPEPKTKPDPFGDGPARVYDRSFTMVYAVDTPAAGTPRIVAHGQGCSETVCFMPFSVNLTPAGVDSTAAPPPATAAAEPPRPTGAPNYGWRRQIEHFSLVARASGYLPAPRFLEFLDAAESGRGLDDDRLADVLRQRGLWLTLLLILLGGLALNLTPCVLPMIPINVAIIGAGAQAGSRTRGFALGGAYGAGIAVAYGALGLAVVLTGAKFGALNASPWFNLAIAALFILLALAMFDVFLIDLSRFQGTAGSDAARRGGFGLAFVLGAVAALLAGACVAPVVISVLLLAASFHASGNAVGLLLPFVLGLGMALPWPFAGAGLSFLPKPGVWMERVKHGFGVLIVLFALYYGYLGVTLLRGANGADAPTPVPQKEGQWLTSFEAALADAQAEGKPLFVDFWATWCKNCLQMDRTTFRNPQVVQRLAGYVRLKYRAEDLNDPETKAVLDRFGAIGLPTYVVLRPDGTPPPASP